MDRRKFNRNLMIAPIELYSNEKNFFCIATDFSAQGLGILSEQQLDLGFYHVVIGHKKIAGNLLYKDNDHKEDFLNGKKFYRYGLEWTKPDLYNFNASKNGS